MRATLPVPPLRCSDGPPKTPPSPNPRLAGPKDLPAMLELETLCFDRARRDSREVLRRSLRHPRHEVWVIDFDRRAGEGLAAALVIRPAGAATLRLHSVATHPDCRGRGLGKALLLLAERRASETGRRRLTLEADAGRPDLLDWYEREGFRRKRRLPDYYGPGRDAWRLSRAPAGSA